jgi:hypothetical protein
MTDDERFNQIRLHHASGDDCAAFLVRYASAQRARADRLAAALEFYADRENWGAPWPGGEPGWITSAADGDRGARARAALAAPVGGEEPETARPRYEDCFGVPGHERCFGGCRVPKRESAP